LKLNPESSSLYPHTTRPQTNIYLMSGAKKTREKYWVGIFLVYNEDALRLNQGLQTSLWCSNRRLNPRSTIQYTVHIISLHKTVDSGCHGYYKTILFCTLFFLRLATNRGRINHFQCCQISVLFCSNLAEFFS
jgi:hypothetical protein